MNMKKLLLIPTALLLATTAPIISLAGCHQGKTPEPEPEPEPTGPTITIEGLGPSYEGYYMCDGSTDNLGITLHDGETTRSVTTEADILIDTYGFSWDKEHSCISWPSYAPAGENKLQIIALYDGIQSEIYSTKVNIEVDGELTLEGIQEEYEITRGDEGRTKPAKVIYWSDGIEGVDITKRFEFQVTCPCEEIYWEDATRQIVWTKDLDLEGDMEVIIHIFDSEGVFEETEWPIRFYVV